MTELLAPCTLLCDAVPDPAVFWAMVGALGTAVTAVVAIVGVYLVYGQVSQIREQSAAHYADGINWLNDYFISGHRFEGLIKGFKKGVEQKNVYEIRRALALILADVDLARHLLSRNYLTNDMLFVVVGLPLARVAEDIERFRSMQV